jgi:hypothetical protein
MYSSASKRNWHNKTSKDKILFYATINTAANEHNFSPQYSKGEKKR